MPTCDVRGRLAPCRLPPPPRPGSPARAGRPPERGPGRRRAPAGASPSRRRGPGRRVAAPARPRGVPRLRPADGPVGRRPPRRRPGRDARTTGPGRAARAGSRSPAGWPAAASWWSTTARPARPTSPSPPPTRSGTVVAAGDPIGSLELVGSHCFPRACLHWGWIRGETYLDPLDLVGAGPVRLLPLWRAEPVPASTTSARLPAYSDWQPLLRLLRPGRTPHEEHRRGTHPAPRPAQPQLGDPARGGGRGELRDHQPR